LIISPSSSGDEDDLNQSSMATDKCSVRDAIIKTLKKKKKSEESSSGKRIFENAE
jgi:hypothetical protein